MLNQTQVIVHSIGQHGTTWWQSDQNFVGKVVGLRSWSWAWIPLLCNFCVWFSYCEGRLVLGFHWLFTVVQLLPMVQLLRREIGTGLSLAVQCCAASGYGSVIEKGDWYSAFIGCSVAGSANFTWQNSTSLTWFYCSGTTNKVIESPPCLIGNTTEARYNTTAVSYTHLTLPTSSYV